MYPGNDSLEKRDHLVCRIEKIYERTVADTEGMEQDDGADAIVDHVCSKLVPWGYMF